MYLEIDTKMVIAFHCGISKYYNLQFAQRNFIYQVTIEKKNVYYKEYKMIYYYYLLELNMQ